MTAINQTQVRFYAKKGKKKGADAKEVEAEATATEKPMSFNEDKLQERMDSTVANMQSQLASLRVGRANPGRSSSTLILCCLTWWLPPALLDKVTVRIENMNLSLRDLAQVTIRDPQTLLVAVYDPEVHTTTRHWVHSLMRFCSTGQKWRRPSGMRISI